MYASATVRFWASQMRSTGAGEGEALANAAMRHAHLMDLWRPKKLPDVPAGVGLDGEPGVASGPVEKTSSLEFGYDLSKVEWEAIRNGLVFAGWPDDDPVLARVVNIVDSFPLSPEESETPPQTPETDSPEG